MLSRFHRILERNGRTGRQNCYGTGISYRIARQCADAR